VSSRAAKFFPTREVVAFTSDQTLTAVLQFLSDAIDIDLESHEGNRAIRDALK